MDRAERRFAYGFLASIVLHGIILCICLLLTKNVFVGATSDEIYEASDIGEMAAQTSLAPLPERAATVVRHHITNIEIVLMSSKNIKQMFGSTQNIASQVRDENLKKARKAIPVVKNPAVKPKLTVHTPVIYPSAAGGVTGTVVVCILVGFDGRPEYVAMAESSGNRFLDAAAVDSCLSWRFTPAKDTQGRIVRCLVYIPVVVK